ncbi:MAG: glycine--tRNA ligase subunit beta [Candidatus Omnitrophica bacterium]|nr:glycine--tRNA ligase subunit beta [Candidatus Omnitrophota bacterium]
MKKVKQKSEDVLFEIGTEELPATMLADIYENPVSYGGSEMNWLEARLRAVFEEKRIAFKACRVWAAPRRIVFWLEGAAPLQTPKEDWIRLLPKDDAYSSEGKPTEKLLLILERRNASLGETKLSAYQNKEYVFIRKSEPVRSASQVLPEIFDALLRSLSFSKTMRWDDSGIYFPRPIRSLLCFYGKKSFSCRVGRLAAANKTFFFRRGERISSTVKDILSYFKSLRRGGIILNPAERKEAIRKKLEAAAKRFKGRLYQDPFLLNEVNFLVESPDVLSAPFQEEFLKLPMEVLTVSMARKQRLFGLLDEKGKVLPRFLALLDGAAAEKQKKGISRNYEHVLDAKLQDSLFFYREDCKTPLQKKRAELKGLIFLKGAGSMLEKTERLVHLAGRAGEWLGWPREKREILERACFLSKSDLLTQMVGEFPELQGIMGRYYALENGEKEEAALAVGEQYLPRTAQDRLPQTMTGALLSVLDKTDLIAACFGLGLEPSSSLDPYGLRRSAVGILRILIDRRLDFSLFRLFQENQKALGDCIQKEMSGRMLERLESFFGDRFEALLVDRGFRVDLVQAVLGSGFEHPYRAYERLECLSKITGETYFFQACKVAERTSNILKAARGALSRPPDPSLFVEDLEREVFRSYDRCRQAVLEAKDARDFKRATSLYAEAFFDILGRFFEKVFVNADDQAVRENRLRLLGAVRSLYADVADLTKIDLR